MNVKYNFEIYKKNVIFGILRKNKITLCFLVNDVLIQKGFFLNGLISKIDCD